MNLTWMAVETRLGRFLAVARDGHVVHVGLPVQDDMTILHDVQRKHARAELQSGSDPVLLQAAAQLQEYAEGLRTDFTFPVAADGTEFQRRVWEELRAIPYGQTRSYGDVAQAIGKPGAARAVGQANHANPLPVVVPCHRVLTSTGSVGGYMGEWEEGGGILFKQRLLELETKGKLTLESYAGPLDVSR